MFGSEGGTTQSSKSVRARKNVDNDDSNNLLYVPCKIHLELKNIY